MTTASTAQTPLFAGVLIGGASRRMQADKALLVWRGRTLVEHVVAARSCPALEEVWLLGAGTIPPALIGCPRLDDAPPMPPAGPGDTSAGPPPHAAAPHRGPLFGILAAMRLRPDAAWVIAACDQPRAGAEAVLWLLAQRRPDAIAIWPRLSADHVEPLLAVYEPPMRRLLEDHAARGQAGLQGLCADPRIRTPAPPPELRACWRNVNDEADFRSLNRA